MADQNCSSTSTSTPVIITSSTEQAKSDADDSNSLSSSCDSRHFECNNSSSDEKISSNSSTKAKLLLNDASITTCSENRNGVKDGVDNNAMAKSNLFLRPSILSSGFSSISANNAENDKTCLPFSLNCPKLNIGTSKFGDNSFTSALDNQTKNAFSSSTSSHDAESLLSSSLQTKKSNSENDECKNNTPNLGMFTNTLNTSSNTYVTGTTKTSIISVPNFVFGQNLHERVTDSATANHKSSTEIKSNGTTEMLFTSVLTSKEIKENLNNDSFGNTKESSSLIEDAARCQEARANKRKYEEVLVTTGEEDEENILQINVKLFAFDNGGWVERGRGILRLNDKKSDSGVSSRIVIRTVGSLRVVLNTKIWNKMSLSRASERSVRLTAIDPNGQVKIFLLQASLKDMASLYPLLEDRIKLCKDHDTDNDTSPDKKVALDKDKM